MENLKKYIKENKVENFFFEGLKERTIEQKYQYIKNHFQYYTMNSWNITKTIASNVKIYNLNLTAEQQNIFFKMNEIDFDFLYESTKYIIEDFEKMTNCDIYFNGRSAGYIVTTPKNSCKNILSFLGVEDIEFFDNYKEFKQEQNNYTGSYNYSYKNEIEESYYFIKAFDKMCDILRKELIYLLDNFTIEEIEQ